jgi:uncharacterized protein
LSIWQGISYRGLKQSVHKVRNRKYFYTLLQNCMPVKKTKPQSQLLSQPMATQIPPKLQTQHQHQHLFHDVFVKRLFLTLGGVLLVYVIFLVGTMIRNNIAQYDVIGQADVFERTISFTAEGKATATPDIAVTTIGMIAEGSSVAEAQTKNTEVMNKLIAGLQEVGISKADIQTQNYNVYPRYDYKEDGRSLAGYEVSQSIRVKIRDLENANKVFAFATESGANSVSGLDFSIDDRDIYVSEAREKALEKLSKKAKSVSRALGVQLGDIVSYDEYEGGGNQPVYARSYALDEAGFGGGSAPSIEAGSTDVRMNVTVTFEIR